MQNLYIILISILLAALLFICIYEFITKRKMKFRTGKHDNFEHALMNDMLYMSISSFVLLIFFLLYNSGFFTIFLKNDPYNKGIIESGLLYGVALVIVGFIINSIYLGTIKCISHWVVLEELEENEKLLIPINMRDGSLICIGKGNLDWNESAPHGAGRLMSRSAAKERYTVSEFKKQMEGIFTTSVNRNTLDECPMAYKNLDDIVNNISDTVVIDKIIKPIYNFKAGGD